jgi:hypothetical protein
MKLRKQAPAKALILALSAGLLFAFYSLVKAEPRIQAEAPSPQPPVDYDRFFAPNASPSTAPQVMPTHARTRAS